MEKSTQADGRAGAQAHGMRIHITFVTIVGASGWEPGAPERPSARPPSGRVVGEAGALSLRKPAVLPGGTVGYAISLRGADRLLSRAGRFFRPLDIDIKHWWEHDLCVLVANPAVLRLARFDAETSTIEPERQRAKRNHLSRLVLNARYQLRFRLNLYVRQFYLRRAHAASDRQSFDP